VPAVEEIRRIFVGCGNFRRMQKQKSNSSSIPFNHINHLENIYPLCLQEIMTRRIFLGFGNFGTKAKAATV